MCSCISGIVFLGVAIIIPLIVKDKLFDYTALHLKSPKVAICLMANIILGVQGEGMGHAMRCSILIKHLRKKHNVKVFASNRAYQFLCKKYDDVHEIQSYNIIYKNNRVRPLSTLGLFLRRLPSYLQSYIKVRHAVRDFNTDIILSDYEPITHSAGFFSGCRNISINNQNDITFQNSKAKPGDWMSLAGTLLVTFFFTLFSHHYIIYSIRKGKNRKNATYVGNLIKEEIRASQSSYGNHVLVYQTSNNNDKLIEILKQTNENYVVYGFNVKKKEGSIVFKTFSTETFRNDLSSAKAVLLNGGLTAITEAIYLKKPILSVPIAGQFEQKYNALTIEEMGFGKHLSKPTVEEIDEFFSKLPEYKKNLQTYQNQANEKIVKDIEKAILSG